jgi:hypothetical protein
MHEFGEAEVTTAVGNFGVQMVSHPGAVLGTQFVGLWK